MRYVEQYLITQRMCRELPTGHGERALVGGQIVGFVTGAAVVTTVNSYRTAGIGHLTFGTSAFVPMTAASTAADPGRRATESLPLLPALVDERLQDRAVLAFLGKDRPSDQVQQDAEPVEDREHPEREPDEVHVHPEVRGKPGTDPGDEPTLPDPEQPLVPAAVVFAHVCDHAHSAEGLSSGIPLLIP